MIIKEKCLDTMVQHRKFSKICLLQVAPDVS